MGMIVAMAVIVVMIVIVAVLMIVIVTVLMIVTVFMIVAVLMPILLQMHIKIICTDPAFIFSSKMQMIPIYTQTFQCVLQHGPVGPKIKQCSYCHISADPGAAF